MANDPLFSNKFMGAVLLAGVFATGAGFVSKLAYGPSELEKNAYPIEVADGSAESAESSEPVDTILWVDVQGLMQTASAGGSDMLSNAIADGQKIFKKCASCHNIVAGAPHKTGPNLWNIWDRQIASAEGYKYSGALQMMANLNWDGEQMNAFLTNPKEYAPGTKMSYKGLKKVSDRASMLLYLQAQSDQ